MAIGGIVRALALCSLLLGCGGPLKYQTNSTSQVPGADAHIVADVRDDEQQTQLTVEVTNLPPPERVHEEGKHYIAWYRKDSGKAWSRVAVLTYEPDSREGRLVSAVPEVAFDFEITAEPDADAVSPSATVVFSQPVGD